MKFILPAVLTIFFHTSSVAQESKNLTPGYYTVVGAYNKSRKTETELYVNQLQNKNLKADYGFDTTRSLFFVYVAKHTSLKESLRYMYEFRKNEEFSDAWVRVISGVVENETANNIQKIPAPPVTIEPRQEPPTKPSQENLTPIKNDTSAEQTIVSPTPSQQPSTTVEPTLQPSTKKEEELIQYNPVNLSNTEVFLSLYNASNNRIVDGDVSVIDTDKGRLIKTVKGNEYLILPDPKNKSGKITLICDVFGYRKLQHEISYTNPEGDTTLSYFDMIGLNFVVQFDLVRYRTGDIKVLSNVYFYNDAAIMLPESQYETNKLLEMMNENPKMKIKLHGHTNGNYHGKIIKMGATKNFFSIGNDALNTVGSAKDLSRERAEIIKQYLLSNGISEDRIVVKGWGGKKPLYDKNGANARKNVRVEVEVIAE